MLNYNIKNNQIKKFWLGEDSGSKSTESDPPSIKLDLPEWKCQQRILNYHECWYRLNSYLTILFADTTLNPDTTDPIKLSWLKNMERFVYMGITLDFEHLFSVAKSGSGIELNSETCKTSTYCHTNFPRLEKINHQQIPRMARPGRNNNFRNSW